MPEASHELFIVWTNTFPADDEEDVRAATATFDDPRVHQFHDPTRSVGRALAPAIDMPTLSEVARAVGAEVESLRGRFRDSYLFGDASVFDTMFFFPPGVEWRDEPPHPSGWVTQLDPHTFLLDESRFHWGEAMGNEMARLARSVRPPASIPGARIWSGAPHNAFGDLIRFGDRLFATCREADTHVGGQDGKVRILASTGGTAWESLALIAEDGIDLRDPKLSVTPSGELLMTCGGVDYSDGLVSRHTRYALSSDGATWTAPAPALGIPTSNWFFRLAWDGAQEPTGFCMPTLWDADPATGKIDGATRRTALFKTADGVRYERVGADLEVPQDACEASLAFEPDGTMYAVLRLASDSTRSLLLTAKPPYEAFTTREVAHGLGGPHLVRLDDGRLIVATREWPADRVDGVDDYATVVLRVDRDGTFERLLMPASGGDTGYPGLVIRGDELWIQYYSSHEGSTALYLARAPLSAVRRP